MVERAKRGSHNIKWEELALEFMRRLEAGWLPTEVNLRDFIREMTDRYYFSEEEPNMFDPKLNTLEGVAPGWLLDKKWRPLPWCVVMGNGFDVAAGIRKLINVGQDESLISIMLEGWRLKGDPHIGQIVAEKDLAAHIQDLKRLQSSTHSGERRLFGYIFCGWHNSALLAISQRDHTASWKEERLVLLVVRQLLLFCAFDVQRVAYFLRESAQEPLAGLYDRVEGEFGYVRASTLKSSYETSAEDREEMFTTFRPIRKSDLKDMEVPPAPKRRGAPASDPKRERPKSRLWPVVARSLKEMPKEQIAEIAPVLNDVIPNLRRVIRGFEREFIEAIKKKQALPSMVATYRFSGLEPMECLLVAVLRLVQAESFYIRLYNDYLKNRDQAGAHPVHLIFTEGPLRPGKTSARYPASCGLPAFSADDVLLGRAVVLAGEYRRLIVKNASRSGKDPEAGTVRGDRDFHSAMTQAKGFLSRVGERELRDGEAPAGSERRTFYLLDVLPDMRLARWPRWDLPV